MTTAKGGRPYIGPVFRARISPEARDRIERLAAESGLNLSEWTRRTLYAAAGLDEDGKP